MTTVVIRIQLFGLAQFLGEQRLVFLPDKRFHLLAYLAYQESWVSREYLQYLFWPDTSSKQASDNLRQLLRRVRSMDVAGLEIERQQVRWQVSTDVQAFKQMIAEKIWRKALEHYQGDFLAGLDNSDVNEFSSWLTLERDRLQAEWRMAVLNQAEIVANEGQFLEASSLLKPLLETNDFDEVALQKYMNYSAHAGGREQALQVYKRFREQLKRDFDLEPISSLIQLAEDIRTQTTSPQATTSVLSTPGTSINIIPNITTSFVGRNLELAEASSFLTNSNCRLLSLVGLGGTGKTRLCLRLSETLQDQFTDGIIFVNLAPVKAELLANTIAIALGQSLSADQNAAQELSRYIADKNILIILDNFEHLLSSAYLVQDLVETCPNLKILASSRERLNIEAEWLLPLEGLNYPKETDLNLEELLQFDAPNLFLDRAKRVKPRLLLEASDIDALLTICNLVEGSPLGLELAAVWVRLLSLQEIADEILKNVDFLASNSRSKVERHHSLRAVFEHSWQLLSLQEQELLEKLSVFTGGFNREAAKQVTGASLFILASLVDKSLLRVSPDGRYSRHMLVYQYSREKLAEKISVKQNVEAKHSQYFIRLLAEQTLVLRGPNSKQAFEILDNDFENIRVSWHWASENKTADLLKQSTFALSNYLDRRIRYQEAFEAFGTAISFLDETNASHRGALASLFTEQSWHAVQLGHYALTKTLAEKGLAFARSVNDSVNATFALNAFSVACFYTGDFQDAKKYIQEAINIPKSDAQPTSQANLITNLANVNLSLGNYKEAQTNLQEALKLYKSKGNFVDMGNQPLVLAESYFLQDRPEDARSLLLENLEQRKSLAVDYGMPEYYNLLARIALSLKEYDQALDYCQQTQTLLEDKSADLRQHYDLKNTLARLAVARADFGQAERLLKEVLDISWARQELPIVNETLAFLAESLANQENLSKSTQLFAFVKEHPNRAFWLKQFCQKQLNKLENKMNKAAFESAKVTGRDLNLDVFMTVLLDN